MSQCHASVSVWFYTTSFALCSPLCGPCLASLTRSENKDISTPIGNEEAPHVTKVVSESPCRPAEHLGGKKIETLIGEDEFYSSENYRLG